MYIYKYKNKWHACLGSCTNRLMAIFVWILDIMGIFGTLQTMQHTPVSVYNVRSCGKNVSQKNCVPLQS